MKAFIAIVLLFLVIAVGYPLVNEDTGSACSALERRIASVIAARSPKATDAVALAALQSLISNGAIAREFVKRHYPNVPSLIACDAEYWSLVINPGQATTVLNELRPSTPSAAEDLIPKTKSQTGDDLTKAAIRALANPTAPAPGSAQPAPPPTYKPGDQKALDRIINNNNR